MRVEPCCPLCRQADHCSSIGVADHGAVLVWQLTAVVESVKEVPQFGCTRLGEAVAHRAWHEGLRCVIVLPINYRGAAFTVQFERRLVLEPVGYLHVAGMVGRRNEFCCVGEGSGYEHAGV